MYYNLIGKAPVGRNLEPPSENFSRKPPAPKTTTY